MLVTSSCLCAEWCHHLRRLSNSDKAACYSPLCSYYWQSRNVLNFTAAFRIIESGYKHILLTIPHQCSILALVEMLASNGSYFRKKKNQKRQMSKQFLTKHILRWRQRVVNTSEWTYQLQNHLLVRTHSNYL